MSEIPIIIQKQIIRLVEEKKKLQIGFISKITQIPEAIMDTHAQSMGLHSDSEFLFLPEDYVPLDFDTFISDPEIEEDQKIMADLRDFSSDFFFCPKCGSKNSFIEQPSFTRHFCRGCSIILDEFWEEYQTGNNPLTNCLSCHQLTFQKQRYCVSCGQIHILEQQKIVRKKPDIALKRAIAEIETSGRSLDDFSLMDWLAGSGGFCCLSRKASLPRRYFKPFIISIIILLIALIVFFIIFFNYFFIN